MTVQGTEIGNPVGKRGTFGIQACAQRIRAVCWQRRPMGMWKFRQRSEPKTTSYVSSKGVTAETVQLKESRGGVCKEKGERAGSTSLGSPHVQEKRGSRRKVVRGWGPELHRGPSGGQVETTPAAEPGNTASPTESPFLCDESRLHRTVPASCGRSPLWPRETGRHPVWPQLRAPAQRLPVSRTGRRPPPSARCSYGLTVSFLDSARKRSRVVFPSLP